MSRIASLSLFAALSAALVESDEAESCVAGDCGVEVQSHSLLQRKHVAAAPAQAHEEATMAKNSIDAPACDGVEADGRCWYLSDQGESCDSTCLKHGLSFKFKTPTSGKPIMPMLLKKDPQTHEGPWRAFECYKPDDDHLHLVSKCSANDYRDNQGSWSDPSCQLACPCGGVKECSWKQPESCLPVFMHKDAQLTGCPKVDSDRPWCSHDHDKTDEWSYCVYTCTDASANGAIEMFSEPPFPEGAEETDTLGAEETDKLSTDSVFLRSEGMVAYPASDAELTKDIVDGAESLKKSEDIADATKDDLKEAKAPLQDSGIASEQSTSKDSEKKLVETHAADGVDSAAAESPLSPVAASTNLADAAKTEAAVVSTEKAAEGNPDGVEKASPAGLKTEGDRITEDRIQTVAFKNGDNLNHEAPDTSGNADKIGSPDEQVGFSKVVEQHNHSSDPETEGKENKGNKENKENKENEGNKEKEEKGKEKKETGDTKKDETTTDESGGKETEKKSEDDDSKNTTSEGSPEKNGSVQPINIFSCLTFALIVGHVFAGSGM